MRLGRTIVLTAFVLSLTILAGCTRGVVPSENTTPDLSWPLTVEQTAGKDVAVVQAPTAQLRLVLADTPAERQRGLSEQDTIPEDGMLFISDPIRQTDIWMRGMRFALDIVWLQKGQIVHVEHSVPAADPADASPPVYGPSIPVDAVIEVAAGSAEQFGLIRGAQVRVISLE